MAIYAFMLGRKHLLSIAELCSVLGPEAKIIDLVPEALITELPQRLTHPQLSLDRLGGTVSVAEIFSQSKKDKSAIVPAVGEFLTTKFQGRPNKLNYGISLSSFTEKHEEILKRTLISLKKDLKKADLKSRFINKNFRNAESAAIQGEKLLEDGAHIAIIQGNHHYFYGHTVALQDFEKYSQRDYDRPGRDPHLGMLPPKLAQIMINLAGKTPLEEKIPGHTLLYDPFAGIGTVLTEGLLLGFDVMGSDINETALQKARKNIDWTTQKYNLIRPQPRLFNKDATQLTKKDLPESPALIVTESYLGPPVSQFPVPENLRKTFNNIRETLIRFFRSVKPLLKKNTPVVISLLAYKRKDRYFFMENIVEEIAKMGFTAEPLIPKTITSKFGIRTFQREGLIYDRPDQIVCREIWRFINK
jgi:tRNA G10  N-methylase Trm11